MSYTPTTWATGDTITAEKLNHLEGGVEAADGADIFLITGGNTHSPLEQTWQEIFNAVKAGKKCYFSSGNLTESGWEKFYALSSISGDTEYGYYVTYVDADGSAKFTCSSPDDYPTMNT